MIEPTEGMIAIERDMLDFRNNHEASYVNSGGAEGHILDMTMAGGYALTTALLLRTIGAKSGLPRLSPLIYGDIGGEVVIVGSKGGAPTNPAWVNNIRAGGEVAFQIATQAFRASWREPAGAERQHIWDFVVEVYPPYADYQAKTDRQIPLFMFRPVEAIPVFTY